MKIKTTLTALLLAFMVANPIAAQSQHKVVVQKNAPATTPNDKQLAQLNLTGAKLTEVVNGIWRVTVNNKKKGFVINSGVFSKGTVGYNGNTPLLVYIDQSKKVSAIYSLRNMETPKYYKAAEKITAKWIGKSVKAAGALKVDAVSGATYSSDAITANVQATIDAYNKHCK